jgi:hypothetical protein
MRKREFDLALKWAFSTSQTNLFLLMKVHLTSTLPFVAMLGPSKAGRLSASVSLFEEKG